LVFDFAELCEHPFILWQLSARRPGGYRSAVGSFDGDYAAVGPNGTDVSKDDGIHWQQTDHLNLNAVSFDGAEGGWAVGPQGTIARFTTHWFYEIIHLTRSRFRTPGVNGCV
jgi:hypothetical protein